VHFYLADTICNYADDAILLLCQTPACTSYVLAVFHWFTGSSSHGLVVKAHRHALVQSLLPPVVSH